MRARIYHNIYNSHAIDIYIRSGADHSELIAYQLLGASVSVAAKNGAILAGLWPCFRWQQPLPAFPRAAGGRFAFVLFLAA
jgi:hypothetical protein